MICPRCEDDQAYKMLEAEDSSWEVYRCPHCNFNCRSSEEGEVVDPGQYDGRFKLTDKRIGELQPNPPIPPLEKS